MIVGKTDVNQNEDIISFNPTCRDTTQSQPRGPFALPHELHERTSAIASTYFELEQSRKAVDAKGKIEIKTCKVCNFTMTCETESDLRSWRFHTHSHVSEKRSSLFAVECNCPGRQLNSIRVSLAIFIRFLSDFLWPF